MNAGQDPYFTHYYRINFDGTGLTQLTEADGNHTVTFSHGPQVLRGYLVARGSCRRWRNCGAPRTRSGRWTWRRRRLGAAGGRASSYPEVFVAKGRDGKTDIWGMIIRPDEFRPGEEISGDREYLRGTAGFVRAQDIQRGIGATRRWRSWDSSWCRSTAWGPATAPRRSTMWRGRIWATRASPTASCGTRRRRRSIRGTTSARVGHLRDVGGRAEFAGRRAVPSGVLQGGGDQQRLPRQSHG